MFLVNITNEVMCLFFHYSLDNEISGKAGEVRIESNWWIKQWNIDPHTWFMYSLLVVLLPKHSTCITLPLPLRQRHPSLRGNRCWSYACIYRLLHGWDIFQCIIYRYILWMIWGLSAHMDKCALLKVTGIINLLSTKLLRHFGDKDSLKHVQWWCVQVDWIQKECQYIQPVSQSMFCVDNWNSIYSRPKHYIIMCTLVRCFW